MARPGLLNHRKFRRLERALEAETGKTGIRGLGRCVALGCLELVWSSAYESGDAVLGTPEDVEAAAGWSGTAGLLFAALRDAGAPEGGVGFVEPVPEKDGIWQIHDLWHHAPDYVAKRAAREVEREQRGETISSLRSKAGKLGAAKRWQTDSKQPPLANDSMANGLPPAPAPTPAPAPHAEACAPKADASAPPVDRPVVIPLDASPLVRFLAETYPDIRDPAAFERAQSAANPGVDLLAAARRAFAWEMADPKRRKHKHGPFLARWFATEQDRGGGRGGAAAPAHRAIAGVSQVTASNVGKWSGKA